MIPDEKSICYQKPDEEIRPTTSIIDVRVPQAFDEAHIRNAENFCVYEIAFLDRIKAAHPSLESELLLYGQSANFKAAEISAGKLMDAGFQNVSVLHGGIEAWEAAGGEVWKGANNEPPTSPEGRYTLDLEISKVRWIGRNLTNQHNGEIACKSGWLEIAENGSVTAGEIIVDMQDISCNDIKDTGPNGVLIAHLSNSDFFQTDLYPTASFSLESFRSSVNEQPGIPNCDVSGNLNARGKNVDIDLKATLSKIDEGFVFQTQFDLDRTLFGAVYGSGKFFERLGMHLVNDLVNIQVTAFFKQPR